MGPENKQGERAEKQLEVRVGEGAATGIPGDTGTWHDMI